MRMSSDSTRGMFTVLSILGLALAFTAFPSPAILAQEAAAQQTSTEEGLEPLPLSPIEKAEQDGTAIYLSLQDITKMALQNNLDIAIQDTNEQTKLQDVVKALSSYDYALTTGVTYNSNKRPNTNLATASTRGTFSLTEQLNWDLSMSKPVEIGGGEFSFQWRSGRSDNNQAFSLFNPQYSTSMTVNYTQPLWRGLGIDDKRAQIRLTNLDLETNDSQFKQKVIDTVSDIQSRYWDLVAAIRDYEIKRNSMRLAQINLRDNRKKVEIGTLAPIGVTESQATVAQREVDLYTSEESIYNVQNNLRALISNDRRSEIWSKVIVPTETPEFTEYMVDLNTAIDTALKNRPELEQKDIELRKTDINLKLKENQSKWQVNLEASFGSQGVAGPQSYSMIGEPQTPPELVGSVGTAYKTLFTEGFTNWSVGLSVQIPLQNRNAEASLAQERISKQKKLMERKNTEQSIQVEIRNAVQQLETNRKQVDTAGIARQFAEEQLDGEEKRYDAGLSQNYLVLQRQNELSQAQYTELRALINYKKAIINLQKAMYILLESNDFEIAKSVPDIANS